MPKKKKTTASGELVLVKSVRRTRSRRMKFCVQGGLGALPSTSIACQFYRKTLITPLCSKKQRTNGRSLLAPAVSSLCSSD